MENTLEEKDPPAVGRIKAEAHILGELKLTVGKRGPPAKKYVDRGK